MAACVTVLAQAWVVGMLHWELILGSPCFKSKLLQLRSG